MNREEIKEKIINCIEASISDSLNQDIRTIKDTDSLFNCGLNSLNTIKVIMAIESELNIEFEDEDIALCNWKNFESIISIIEKRLS